MLHLPLYIYVVMVPEKIDTMDNLYHILCTTYVSYIFKIKMFIISEITQLYYNLIKTMLI